MKIFYHFNGKVQKNFKYNEFLVSYMPNYFLKFDFQLSLQRCFGNLSLLNVYILGIFSIDIAHTREQDHAGFSFSLNILGFDIDYSYKDVRHYDHDNERFEEYNNE